MTNKSSYQIDQIAYRAFDAALDAVREQIADRGEDVVVADLRAIIARKSNIEELYDSISITLAEEMLEAIEEGTFDDDGCFPFSKIDENLIPADECAKILEAQE